MRISYQKKIELIKILEKQAWEQAQEAERRLKSDPESKNKQELDLMSRYHWQGLYNALEILTNRNYYIETLKGQEDK